MTSGNQRKITPPQPNIETQHFWDAAAAGKFVLPFCLDCSKPHWYPRALCPFCFSDRIEWKEASGRGTIYSFTVMRRESVPYALAYVTLEEGPTMMSNLVEIDLESLVIGQAVSLVFQPSDGGPPVPMFKTVKEPEAGNRDQQGNNAAPADPLDDPRMTAIAKGMVTAYFAKTNGDAPAVIDRDRTVSFTELNSRANQLVRALRVRGVKKGDGIALMCSNRLEFVDVMVAADRAGLRFTPVNHHLNGDEAGYILGNCEAVAFVAEARFAANAATAAAAAPGATVRLAVGGDIAGFESYDAAIVGEAGSDIDDPVLGSRMFYTSGTTGRPKGVYRPPGEALATVLGAVGSATTADYQAGMGQLHLCTGPLYHAAPLGCSLAQPLLAGVGVVLMDRWDAEEALRLIERHRITHTHMVPTMFHRLLSLPQDVRSRYAVSSLQFVIHGGAPCPVPVKAALIEWWGPLLYEYYAATEGLGVTVSSTDWLKKPGTVGKPATENHIRILDGDGKDLPPNTAGTVYVKSPPIGRFKYFKDDSKTIGAYKGEYYTLEDVGYLDDDGWLFLTDRSAHLIISGGVNIYPAEIEAVLITHPAVGDVGVIGMPNEEWGEEVKAVIELQPGIKGSPELAAELLAFCKERLARFKCPRSVDFSDKLPRLDNGKLYKKGLRDAYRAAATNEARDFVGKTGAS